MDNDEFTFAVVPPSVAGDGGGVFLSGRMGTLYPVFGRPRSPPRPPPPPEPETATVRVPLRQLLLVDREPSPAQLPDDDLATVPAELYCPRSPGWSAAAAAPSLARWRKSGSTGSVLRWRPRLAVGRSQSDGKEKFVFLSASAAGSGRKGRVKGEGGGVWSYYAKGSGSGNGPRRRTFLPYKQDLVGLFANAAAFRRSYHPF